MCKILNIRVNDFQFIVRLLDVGAVSNLWLHLQEGLQDRQRGAKLDLCQCPLPPEIYPQTSYLVIKGYMQ